MLAHLLFAMLALGARITIVDSSGSAVPNATALVRSASGVPVAQGSAGVAGEIALDDLPPGAYTAEVRAEGFSPATAPLRVPGAVTVVLSPGVVHTVVTVTPSRGAGEDAAAAAQVVSVRSGLRDRPLATLGNALERTPGVLVQQSTYAQVSPFLRGLTGYHVLNLVDSVRFSNSTMRSGPNQYLAWIDPSQARLVETALGPAGALYGSDSLGGTIQVLTPDPEFSAAHGGLTLFAGSADRSAGGDGNLSVGGRRLWWLAGAGLRSHGDVRPGGGFDSRDVFRRMFGVPMVGPRLPGTGFRQHAWHTKLAARPSASDTLSFWFQRSAQDGVEGYKDLLGGLGRLRSDFTPQRLTFGYLRYERLGAGPLDSVSATLSLNAQDDGSVRQGLLTTDPVIRDRVDVDAWGYTAQAATHASGQALVFGAEAYDERISASRTVAGVPSRPLYPNDSRYVTVALFGQDTVELLSRRVRLNAGGRLNAVRYNNPADAAFVTPGSRQNFRDLSFNASVLWQVRPALGVHFLAGRGFRAPNLNDLGALGLNDLGYEVPAAGAIASGALLATSASESALPAGRAVQPLSAERLYNYEAGLRFSAPRFYARVQGFDAEFYNPIVRRTLLWAAASPPAALGGLAVAPLPQSPGQAQAAVVTVATPFDSRAVKAFVNDGRARYLGIETLARWSVHPRWTAEGAWSFLAGRELNPNRNVRRLPPQHGHVTLRHTPSRGLPWVEVSGSFAGAQKRLSGGDLEDERIGAARSRRDIAAFYASATAAPYIARTGETLAQIQDRVLPGAAESARIPLYVQTDGWITLDVAGGMPLGERMSINFALTNLLDRNYRVHGSGIDAPGRGAYLSIGYRF